MFGTVGHSEDFGIPAAFGQFGSGILKKQRSAALVFCRVPGEFETLGEFGISRIQETLGHFRNLGNLGNLGSFGNVGLGVWLKFIKLLLCFV